MRKAMKNGDLWPDEHGVHLNAHGAGLLHFGDMYYLYGEHKVEGSAGNRAWVGVHVYSSDDLLSWKDCGICFDLRSGRWPQLRPGQCIVERPKVLYCAKTGKFVLWCHVEFAESYLAACVGIAVSDTPTGPFELLRIQRPVAGIWPDENLAPAYREPKNIELARAKGYISNFPDKTPDEDPAFYGIVGRDFYYGQESRDMTLFKDDDGRAYLVHSSEANSTIHFAELNDTYTGTNGVWWRAFEFRRMEAPVLFRHNNKYYFIGSGCTGWAPNAARSAVADSLRGPWHELGNPCVGSGSEITFGSQPAYAFHLSDGRIIMMFDQWHPDNAIDGRYMWLPVEWEDERPVLRYRDYWNEITDKITISA